MLRVVARNDIVILMMNRINNKMEKPHLNTANLSSNGLQIESNLIIFC